MGFSKTGDGKQLGLVEPSELERRQAAARTPPQSAPQPQPQPAPQPAPQPRRDRKPT